MKILLIGSKRAADALKPFLPDDFEFHRSESLTSSLEAPEWLSSMSLVFLTLENPESVVRSELQKLYQRLQEAGSLMVGLLPLDSPTEKIQLLQELPVAELWSFPLKTALLKPRLRLLQERLKRLGVNRKTQRLLQESQQMLQLVMDNIPQAIFWKDRESSYLGCNSNFAAHAGLDSPSAIQGLTDFDLPWTQEESESYRSMDREVMTSNQAQLHILEPQHQANGRSAWVETNKIPLQSPSGDVFGILGTYLDVTERIESDKALRESEERFRQIAENIEQVFWVSEPRGGSPQMLYISPAFDKVFGFDREQIYQEPWKFMALVEPEDQEAANEAFQRWMQGDDFQPINYKIRRLDGQRRWLSSRAFPIYNQDGQMYRLAGLTEDITERESSRHLLQELVRGTVSAAGKEFFPALVDSLAEVMKVQCVLVTEMLPSKAPSARVLASRINGVAGPTYEYPLKGTPCEYVHQKGAAFFGSQLRDRFPEDKDLEDLGAESYLGVCMIDASGKVRGHICLIDDEPMEEEERLLPILQIFAARACVELQRQRIEEELRRSNQKLQATLQALPDLLFTFNRDGEVLDVSEGRNRSLLPTGDLLGKTLLELLGPAEGEALQEGLEKALDRQMPVIREYSVTLVGRLHFFEARFVPCSENEAIALVRNITKRRQAEEERLTLEKQLQHTQKLESLGVLAGGIAHDFNNLLTTILVNTNLALADLPRRTTTRPHVEQIKGAALRAADLTTQLLAYSGKGQFVIEAIDLSSMVLEMSELLRAVISKKAKLTYNFAPQLPLLEGDPTQLRQVMMNLITNASEALGEGTGTISIRTGVLEATEEELGQSYIQTDLKPGPYIFLSITDSGCGMDESTRMRIFDPFFTTKFTGRGLGLAAVLGIVRGHGGTVLVESQLGQGTNICCIFPLDISLERSQVKEKRPASNEFHSLGSIPDELETSQPVAVGPDDVDTEKFPRLEEKSLQELQEEAFQATPLERKDSTPLSRKSLFHEHVAPSTKAENEPAVTVLIVDDESAVRFAAEKLLELCGYGVIPAEDGLKAMELFQKHQERITLVLLDLTMPQMSGAEVFQRMRQVDPKLPILLTSGYSEQEATRQFARQDLSGFIKKPYSPQQLLLKVREILESKGISPPDDGFFFNRPEDEHP